MSCLLELVIGLGPAESSLILLFPVRGVFYSGAAEMSVSISQRCVDLSEPTAVGPPEIPPSPWFRSLTVDLTKVTNPQHLQSYLLPPCPPPARNLRQYWGSLAGISPTDCMLLRGSPRAHTECAFSKFVDTNTSEVTSLWMYMECFEDTGNLS